MDTLDSSVVDTGISINVNPFGDMLATAVIVTVRTKTYAKNHTQIIAYMGICHPIMK